MDRIFYENFLYGVIVHKIPVTNSSCRNPSIAIMIVLLSAAMSLALCFPQLCTCG